MKTYCGRPFSERELDDIRKLIHDHPGMHRAELSRQVCQRLRWYKADGGLKDMSCRVAMLRMEKDGLLTLPPPRRKKAPPYRCRFSEISAPGEEVIQPYTR